MEYFTSVVNQGADARYDTRCARKNDVKNKLLKYLEISKLLRYKQCVC